MKGKARRISKRLTKRGKRTSKRLTKRGKRTSKRLTKRGKRTSKRRVSKRTSKRLTKRGKRLTLGRFERDDGIMIGGGRWKERAKKIKFTVKEITGNEYPVEELGKRHTINELKEVVDRILGSDGRFYDLIGKGGVLLKDDTTLGKSGIEDGDHVSIRPNTIIADEIEKHKIKHAVDMQKKLAAQKEAASAAEAAQKARIEELEAELLRQQVRAETEERRAAAEQERARAAAEQARAEAEERRAAAEQEADRIAAEQARAQAKAEAPARPAEQESWAAEREKIKMSGLDRHPSSSSSLSSSSDDEDEWVIPSATSQLRASAPSFIPSERKFSPRRRRKKKPEEEEPTEAPAAEEEDDGKIKEKVEKHVCGPECLSARYHHKECPLHVDNIFEFR
uniref:Ubiquitin-like domain-containing protein n=1 Tax=viral metagenome TaxID=1070528 RepID=A0A6C0L1E6_9ZZZZ